MLPYAIEYLLTKISSHGDRLAWGGISQTIIPVYPPGQIVTLQLLPFVDDYCNIVYESAVGPGVVPGVFTVVGSQYGNKQQDGVLGTWMTNFELFSFVPITHSSPAFMRLDNISPLNQYYEGIAWYICIKTESDYNEALEELNRAGTSTRTESAVESCKQLLELMVTSQGGVVPPEGGG